MRVRILLTDGPQVEDLYWIEHNGTDVYFGICGINSKGSAHASGRIHIKDAGVVTSVGKMQPLQELRGHRHLETIGFPNSLYPRRGYSGGKSDAVMWVDVRSVPANVTANLLIGLVEPHNGAALAEIMRPVDAGGLSFEPKQLLLNTSVKPWVYVAVAWIVNRPEQGSANG